MKTLAAFIAACALSGQAMAGGLTEVAPEAPVAPAAQPAPAFDWTGFYSGLSVTDGSVSDGNDFDTSGFGVQAGYLHDLGTFVVGGELAYSDAEVDDAGADITATRLKLIGGYDAGRFLPYAFVGVSDVEVTNSFNSVSDTVTNYGLGARYAFGADGRFVGGLEYIVEDKSNFGNTGFDLDRDEVALRFDYRF
ncbi:MAG: porin family protein [Rhodobacteraceae bacterium]|nr:porin family protein [Paracoccaceae bacterium]